MATTLPAIGGYVPLTLPVLNQDIQTWSDGSTYTVDLIEGFNVRDHLYGAYVKTNTDPMTTQAVFGENSPGHAHYDMLTFALPSAFETETLDEIVFFSTSEGVYLAPHGKAFLAGVTVFTRRVPEASSTLVLLGGAMELLGLLRGKIPS